MWINIIYEYDLPYPDILHAELCNLVPRTSELCQNLVRKTLSHAQGFLYNLLPFNVTRPSITLRNRNPMYIPFCKLTDIY